MSGAACIILGRGGSKGLPGKNAALVAGCPCIAWTIEAARRSARVDRVVVSSDAPDLLAIGQDCGARTIRRPDRLAGDDTPIDEAARHALAKMEEEDGGAMAGDAPIVILYANVPVRPTDLIDRAVGLLVRSGADSVQSYAPVGKHHPWWTVRIDDGEGGGEVGARVRPWEGQVVNHGCDRRQDLPPAFIPDGGVIAVARRGLMLEVEGVAPGPHAFLGIDRRAVVTGEGEVIDIDSRVDLLVADVILRERGG